MVITAGSINPRDDGRPFQLYGQVYQWETVDGKLSAKKADEEMTEALRQYYEQSGGQVAP